jgi:hypothetical protein
VESCPQITSTQAGFLEKGELNGSDVVDSGGGSDLDRLRI